VFSHAFAFVVATEDNTAIEITPAANTLTHTAAAGTFTVLLQKGQIYNLMGTVDAGNGNFMTGVDLTGTRIRSISTGINGCKKIAVYCGTGKINISCGGGFNADNFIQQCFPSSAWGVRYLTAPTNFMPNNYFRVMVKDPATVVKVNGAVINNLINGRYYEFGSNGPNMIEADKPVVVAQYITSGNTCGNTVLGTNGDPEMIYLSPLEQTISNITLNSTSHSAITRHYINVILLKSKVPSFRLDGAAVAANAFIDHPTAAGYAYAIFTVQSGSHHLTADTGFSAIAYGYGPQESYGYNAGANVERLLPVHHFQ
jgi:hypothetical protein